MSALDLETLPTPNEIAPDPRLRWKQILDRLVGLATRSPEQSVVSPELEAEILIQELKVVADPFKQLDYAVNLRPSLPETAVQAELEPLIDTVSNDTLEYLQYEEKTAKVAHEYSLGLDKARTCILAWDVHRSDETEKLAAYAAKHVGGYDGQNRNRSEVSQTYVEAFNRAKDLGISFDEALQAVNTEAFSKLSDSHQYEYPFLYDRSVSSLSDKKYRFATHPRDIVANN